MASIRTTILALTGACALAIGAASGAYAYGGLSSGDEADDEFMQQMQSGGGVPVYGGANLAIPGALTAGAPVVQCDNVLAAPSRFSRDIVRSCRAHVR